MSWSLLLAALQSSQAAPLAVVAAPSVRDCAECPELLPLTVRTASGKTVQYALARTELTYRDYLPAMRSGCPLPTRLAPELKTAPGKLADDVAIGGLDRAAIDCYLTFVSKRSGKRFRLPTIDEWRWAAFGTGTSRYPWGAELGKDRAFMGGQFDETRFPWPTDRRSQFGLRMVGQLPANPLGFYDMIGNASEFIAQKRSQVINDGKGTVYQSTAIIGGDVSWFVQQPGVEIRYVPDDNDLVTAGLRVARDVEVGTR